MHIRSGNNILSIVCVLMLISLVLLALLLAFLYSRKRGREDQAMAARMGFTPLDKPDDDFMQRLRGLYQPSRLERVAYLSRKDEGTERLFLFDSTTSSPNIGRRSRSSANSEYRNVAIISPHLRLPTFILIRRMPALGPPGNVLNDLVTSAVSLTGLAEYSEAPPEFSLNYLLYTHDEPRVRNIFNERALSQIAQVEGIVARLRGHPVI